MIKGKQQAFEEIGQRVVKEWAVMCKLERKNVDMEGSVTGGFDGVR